MAKQAKVKERDCGLSALCLYDLTKENHHISKNYSWLFVNFNLYSMHNLASSIK
jgi:hypothetical protein